MALPHAIRTYLLHGLRATPVVLGGLLREVAGDDPVWDFRPDPERFTLREALAHVAQWEGIHLARLQRILSEEEPTLGDIDEGHEAVVNDYAHHDPQGDLALLASGRAAIVHFLDGLPAEAWVRAALRPPLIGRLTLEDYAVLIVGHDGYHTAQAVEWLRKHEGA